MAGIMDNLQTINSFARTVLAFVVIGGLGGAGWYGYTTYYAADIAAKQAEQDLAEAQNRLAAREAALADSLQQIERQRAEIDDKNATIDAQGHQIDALEVDIEQKKAEIQRLDTALRLHKMQRRLAKLRVVDVATDPATGKTHSDIEFWQLSDAGDPIGQPKRLQVEGDMVFVDYLVVKFDDKYVEQADLERGTSICMFHRLFGEYQKPKDGFELEQPGTHPGAYSRGNVLSEFEAKIWNDFWTIANDPEKSADLGIRAAHGDAVSIRVQPGKTYRITVRASGSPELSVENGSGTAAGDDSA